MSQLTAALPLDTEVHRQKLWVWGEASFGAVLGCPSGHIVNSTSVSWDRAENGPAFSGFPSDPWVGKSPRDALDFLGARPCFSLFWA